MKQVKQRTLLIYILLILFVAGLVLYTARYVALGSRWASFPGNLSAYDSDIPVLGQILDRSGVVLYDAAQGAYSDDDTLRRATLHAVGDREGNISTSALQSFQKQLIGYSLLGRVYLTLDSRLQTAAYEALNGANGTIGVYNYQTGEILCMVSSPSFDPADPPEIRDGDTQYDGVYLNRFLSSAFTPGSVFKVVTAAAALEKLEGVASRTFHCSGSVTIGGDTITCPYVHGDMDFYGAMANSCNCVFAQLAVELGGDTLSSYAQQAGLLDGGSVSGIDTAAGTYVISENDSEVGWSGVGQYEDLANPCALMTMMGAIAGRGSAREPYLLGKVTSMTGTAARSTGTSGTMHLWNADTCQALAQQRHGNLWPEPLWRPAGVRQIRHRRGGAGQGAPQLVCRIRGQRRPPPGLCSAGGKRRRRQRRSRQRRSPGAAHGGRAAVSALLRLPRIGRGSVTAGPYQLFSLLFS